MERKNIGEFIAVLRKANGLTQRQLAEKLNVSEKSISRWERNETSPDLALIPVIAELFSVTSDELLRGERTDPAAIAAPSVKQEKRIAYLFKQALARHRLHSIVAVGISLCGAVPALLLHNHISYRYYIWVVVASVVAQFIAALYQLGITANILPSIDSEEFIGNELYKTRDTLVTRTFWVIGSCILWAETFFFIITMVFSAGMVPNYILVKTLGLSRNPWALILPSVVQVYNMILIKSYLEGVPKELEESAKIDGANALQTMFQVMIPVSLPCVASVSMFTAVSFWNNYTSALLYLGTEEKWYPLSLYILNYIQTDPDVLNPTMENLQKANIESAMVIFSILPILLVYPFMQRFFVKGIMLGAVKG